MTASFDAELVLDAQAEVGEGPAWDAAAGRLIWVDITASRVHELYPDGLARSWEVGEHVGAAAPRASGGLVLATCTGFAALAPDGSVTPIALVEADVPANRMNDGKCDPQGRFWAGTMPYQPTPGAGSLYRLDPDGRVERVLSGLGLANGLGWSPDAKTLYFIDSTTQSVGAYDFDPGHGSLSSRRLVAAIDPAEGMPDGMTVDDEGYLWVALWGGGCVRRYRPDGTISAVVHLPVSQVTSCAFGGPDGSDLYITSAAHQLSEQQLSAEPHAGGLFRCRPGITGPPAIPYSG